MPLSEKELAADPIRRIIRARIEETGWLMHDLSLKIGMNQTYVSQYLSKGQPKELPERPRRRLAEILEIPESMLIKPDHLPPASPGLPPAVRVAAAPAMGGRDVPVFQDTDRIDHAAATEWTYRPPSLLTAGQTFAVWISAPRAGRLRSGDLAYVRPTQPPRIGDTVVALGEDNRIRAVGELVEQAKTADTIEVDSGDRREVKHDGHRLLKVALVQLP